MPIHQIIGRIYPLFGALLVVYESAIGLMEPVGGVLAVLDVIVLPVTSGDTAFRAVRLTIAETVGLSQTASVRRLAIAVPLFIIGIALSFVDFNVIWRYFAWSNQTLAAIALYAVPSKNKNEFMMIPPRDKSLSIFLLLLYRIFSICSGGVTGGMLGHGLSVTA